MIDDELDDTAGNKPASLFNFTFDKFVDSTSLSKVKLNNVEVQFPKFDLLNYWPGTAGGGLQYFAAIPGGKYQQHSN